MSRVNDDTEALLLARDLVASRACAIIRKRGGLSQPEAGRASGVSVAAIRAYEQGLRRPSGDAGVRYGRLLRELMSRGRR